MDALLIRERYKVVRAVRVQPDYALLEAVDIAERETPSRLLNLFEGELLHRYARICSAIRKADCPEFQGMFLEKGTLVAVFSDCGGESVDRLFYRGDAWAWQDRLLFVELVLHHALSLANLPPEVSCAAMLSENLLFDPPNGKVESRFMLTPMEDMNARELVLLALDQVKKILPRTAAAGKAEQAFHDRVAGGAFRSVVQLYAYWHETEPLIREERAEFEKQFIIKRWCVMLWRRISARLRRGDVHE